MYVRVCVCVHFLKMNDVSSCTSILFALSLSQVTLIKYTLVCVREGVCVSWLALFVCVRECVCVCVCLCVGERAIISLSVFTPVMSFLTQKITGHMVQSGLAAACGYAMRAHHMCVCSPCVCAH